MVSGNGEGCEMTERKCRVNLISSIQTEMEKCLADLVEDTPYTLGSRSNVGIYWRAGALAMFKKCEKILQLKRGKEEKKCQKTQ
jgi:hypothetical protein